MPFAVVMRRVLIGLGAVGIVVCVLILLNFTAENPTRRRHSSTMPTVDGDNIIEKGLTGELALAKDLGLPRNEERDQLQCICGNAYTIRPKDCNACIVKLPSVQTYRRPDFVSPDFLAEAKNLAKLPATQRDLLTQIKDYADAAKALHIPLWVYVRVDTEVDSRYDDLVEATGGDIVYYFVVPGYQDPLSEAAKKGLVLCVPLLAGGAWLEKRSWQRRPAQPVPARPRDGGSAADTAEVFVRSVKQHAQEKIDREDSRRDL